MKVVSMSGEMALLGYPVPGTPVELRKCASVHSASEGSLYQRYIPIHGLEIGISSGHVQPNLPLPGEFQL
eukprot:2478030-Rhodomonas_salina.1